GPEYAFTVGLYYTYNHPEILIMGIKHEVCIEFFHLIVNKIKNGSKFIDGVVDRELSSYPYNAFYFNERKANIYMAFGCQGKNHLNRSENRQ
ncbi:MAG: DUF4262 domain-containing protein, partial [Desulfobacteraceae bacterium]